MMSDRTRFLVWWGLPILCAGLGALAATMMGADGARDKLGLLILVGGYFAAIGLLAVIFRIRQSEVTGSDRDRFDRPVEAAMVAMCAPVLLVGLWVLMMGFVADFGRSQTISARIESVDRLGAFGRSYAVDLDTTVTPLILQCRLQRNCGSPTPLMQLKPGTPVTVTVLNNRILGLSAQGRELVGASGQRIWRLISGGGLFAFLAAYTLAFAAVSMRLLFGGEEPVAETHYSTWTNP